ncbi:MAG: hypothetical protein AXW13_03005 [Alcanivorax sp. Nap_24]|nr:MAG: hypothetical protein AXW13_03005 [Alcanivorax sp. Nap_24]
MRESLIKLLRKLSLKIRQKKYLMFMLEAMFCPSLLMKLVLQRILERKILTRPAGQLMLSTGV